MDKLEYLKNGDCFIPNLTLREPPQMALGKYGRMRKPIYRNTFLCPKCKQEMLINVKQLNTSVIKETRIIAYAAIFRRRNRLAY